MMDENVNLKSLGDIVSSCVSRKDGECDAFIFSHFVYENVSTAQQRLSYRDLAECVSSVLLLVLFIRQIPSTVRFLS